MIGKERTRTGHHAGAMGGSNSDLMSIEQLASSGFTPTAGGNKWATGTYATGNKVRGIRNYAGNFPQTGAFPTPGVSPLIDPLNFSDIGYDLTGPQVHADGEIWTATNFSIRRALEAKYGSFPSSDAGCSPSASTASCRRRTAGNRRWIQLPVRRVPAHADEPVDGGGA